MRLTCDGAQDIASMRTRDKRMSINKNLPRRRNPRLSKIEGQAAKTVNRTNVLTSNEGILTVKKVLTTSDEMRARRAQRKTKVYNFLFLTHCNSRDSGR